MTTVDFTIEYAIGIVRTNLRAIADHERSILSLAFEAGRVLNAVLETIPYGGRMAQEAGIAQACGASARTLRRYRQLAARLGEYEDILTSEQVQIGLGILYALTSGEVSAAARGAVVGEIKQSGHMSTKRAKAIIETSQAVDDLPDAVRDNVRALVFSEEIANPEVVVALAEIALKNPVQFAEIATTKAVEVNGTQIPLAQADQHTLEQSVKQAASLAAGEVWKGAVYGSPDKVVQQLRHYMDDPRAEYKVVIYQRLSQ